MVERQKKNDEKTREERWKKNEMTKKNDGQKKE